MAQRDLLADRDLNPDRVSYATGALLGADDFAAEQAYHRGRLARALQYLHGTGTVAGLGVTVAPPAEGESGAENGDRVTVRPGMALDPRGRIVEVRAPACIRLGRWLHSQGAGAREAAWIPVEWVLEDRARAEAAGLLPAAAPAPTWAGVFAVDVFVAFRGCERGKTPAFAHGAYEALDAVAPSRIRDAYELSLVFRQRGNTPLPEGAPARPYGDPWDDVPTAGTGDDLLREVQEAILDRYWTEGTEHDDEHGVRRLPEHALTQDGSEVFLARLVVPARRPSAGERAEGQTLPAPVRDGARPVTLNNHLRRFVYPTAAALRLLRLGLPAAGDGE